MAAAEAEMALQQLPIEEAAALDNATTVTGGGDDASTAFTARTGTTYGVGADRLVEVDARHEATPLTHGQEQERDRHDIGVDTSEDTKTDGSAIEEEDEEEWEDGYEGT